MIAAVLALLLLASVASVTLTIDRMNRDLSQRYAAMDTGYWIVDFISETEGNWPESWGALEQHATSSDRNANRDFNWFQENVNVNWEVDVDKLREAESPDSPPYPVVTTKDNVMAGPTWTHEANRNIWLAFNNGKELPPPSDTMPR
ncbi:MAG: hypothetical protein AAGE65_13330 [Planctomycetota bacterium]